jgi:hypothetical protein
LRDTEGAADVLPVSVENLSEEFGTPAMPCEVRPDLISTKGTNSVTYLLGEDKVLTFVSIML